MENTLTDANINPILSDYLSSIDRIGDTVNSLKGIPLFRTLKRKTIGIGPYPGVTLFEAANRIMTDLVILYGVKWLLENETFPFESYLVEFGNDDKNDHDILADNSHEKLIGEAFNVAPSFFQGKKASMLKKLRAGDESANHRLIIVNSDAVRDGYRPKLRKNEYMLFVDVESAAGNLLSMSAFA